MYLHPGPGFHQLGKLGSRYRPALHRYNPVVTGNTSRISGSILLHFDHSYELHSSNRHSDTRIQHTKSNQSQDHVHDYTGRDHHHSLFLSPAPKRPLLILSCSSPSNLTNPPNKSGYNPYCVFPFLILKIGLVNGNPKANSSTSIPNNLAAIKCPNSWTSTKIDRTTKNITPVAISQVYQTLPALRSRRWAHISVHRRMTAI